MISVVDRRNILVALESDPIGDLEGLANGTRIHLIDTGEDIIYDAENDSWHDMTTGAAKTFS